MPSCNRVLAPRHAFYLATLGGARALRIDGRIGSFEKGREADFIVLDSDATAMQGRRNPSATSLDERLSALMMLGDYRSIAETYVKGTLAWQR